MFKSLIAAYAFLEPFKTEKGVGVSGFAAQEPEKKAVDTSAKTIGNIFVVSYGLHKFRVYFPSAYSSFACFLGFKNCSEQRFYT